MLVSKTNARTQVRPDNLDFEGEAMAHEGHDHDKDGDHDSSRHGAEAALRKQEQDDKLAAQSAARKQEQDDKRA